MLSCICAPDAKNCPYLCSPVRLESSGRECKLNVLIKAFEWKRASLKQTNHLLVHLDFPASRDVSTRYLLKVVYVTMFSARPLTFSTSAPCSRHSEWTCTAHSMMLSKVKLCGAIPSVGPRCENCNSRDIFKSPLQRFIKTIIHSFTIKVLLAQWMMVVPPDLFSVPCRRNCRLVCGCVCTVDPCSEFKPPGWIDVRKVK